MSVGLLALLDDVATFAKVAAASIDDVAGAAAKASAKAAGAVIDDTAVTPNYVTGFTADRELPLIARIALGSIRNKLLILLPAALVLSLFLPWAITPLLALGGAYLCYEGAEKVYEGLFPHEAHEHEATLSAPAVDPKTFEDARVAGAIQTDFILSAEIMTIALATVPDLPFWQQAAVLAVVGVFITLAVYGVVALIVKADDIGLGLAQRGRTGAGRALGRGLVVGVPYFLQILGVVGTAAMIWVGGGIVVHGLAEFGLPQVDHLIEGIAHRLEEAAPVLGAVTHELVVIAGDFIFGLALGALLIPVVSYAVTPVWKAIKRILRRGKAEAPAVRPGDPTTGSSG
jgi:predicted DNA repair protein MutK